MNSRFSTERKVNPYKLPKNTGSHLIIIEIIYIYTYTYIHIGKGIGTGTGTDTGVGVGAGVGVGIYEKPGTSLEHFLKNIKGIGI